MTRPIVPRPFNAVCAPSKSRPQLSYAKVHADALAALSLMGASGVAGFTEISHPGIKALFASVFGRRVGLGRSDCPIVWTEDFTKLDGGTDFGAAAIRVVAPIRRTTWAQLGRVDGLTVGVVAVHMHPGGFARHPSQAQREARPLIRRRWKRHAARINRRLIKLDAICDYVVMVGDVNRHDLITFAGCTRLTGPGLLYVGVNAHGLANAREVCCRLATYHPQHADHGAAVVTVTPKEKP